MLWKRNETSLDRLLLLVLEKQMETGIFGGKRAALEVHACSPLLLLNLFFTNWQ